MKFSDDETGSYYDQTQNHYERWWKLKETQAVQDGLWDKLTYNSKFSLGSHYICRPCLLK